MKKITLLAVSAFFAATASFAQANLRNNLSSLQSMPQSQRVSQKDVTPGQRQLMLQGQKAVQAKAPRRAGIETRPEGTVFELLGSYSGLAYNWYYGWRSTSTSAAVMTLVEGTDGNIYVQGLTPYAGLDAYYWVKAERAGVDTVVIRQQPSGYYEDYSGVVHEYEIARISYSYDEAEGEETIRVADDPDIKLLYKGNGVLESVSEMTAEDGDIPAFIYGSVYWYENSGEDDSYPSGYYTNNEYYWALSTRVNDETYFEPSADAAIEQMALAYRNVNNKMARMIDVAFEGDAVYMKFYTTVPGWVKGTINGDKVVVENGQFLGYDTRYTSYQWAHTATVETLYDDTYPQDPYYDHATFVDQLEFDYDPETHTMSSTGAVYIDGEKDRIYYAEYFNEPNISRFSEVPAVPADPVISRWWDYDEYYESAELDFTLSQTDVDGRLILADKLSYVVYVDGEVFTFATDEYEEFEEDTEELPFGFSSYNIGTSYLLLFFQPAENVGMQTIYRGGGVENRSNIVWYDVNTGEISVEPYDNTVGVQSVVAAAERTTDCYDLQGRRANGASKGLLLKRITATDGTQSVVKVIRK